MFGFISGSSRWQQFSLFFTVVALLFTVMWCYDPCPENLRRSRAAKPCNIPKNEIEKAFQDGGKTVDNKNKQEKRLVREGKVVNRRIKSAESTHQQAFVKPEVRDRELRQRTFQEASCILTKKYRLSPEEVCCSLPKADLSSPTAARAVQSCNPTPVQCDSSSRYRTADGTCNNLDNPTWGSALSCFNRLLPPVYSDNEEFRRSVTGSPLPNPRTLSRNLHAHQNRATNLVNHMYVIYGQFLDHDFTLTSASTTADNEAIECCPISTDNHPQCAPVLIPSNDPFYSQFNITCLNFVRSALCPFCTTGPRVQMNQVTAFIDGSPIYGNNNNETNGLRDPNRRGNLRVLRSSVGDLLPQSNEPENDQCSIPAENRICFQAGDIRANQHPALTAIHTLCLREHNRVADQLRTINPQWSEERIFQEARKIVGAELHMITYDEYLPVTLGSERMDYFNLWVTHGSGPTTYDPQIDPTLMTEFSTFAFRFGHTMVNSLFDEVPRTQGHSGHLLRNIFFWPFEIYRGEIDPLMRGSTRSPAQYFDRHVVPDVTNFLYRIRGNDTGLDLPAFNIQRGRDHGIAPYVDIVRYCSQDEIIIRNFDDLNQVMSAENAELLRQNYRDVRDVDPFAGMLLERWKEGAVVPPTAICVIGIQFHKLKYGDRYYFEHDRWLTPSQRYEVKKTSLARILCDNTGIQEIQPRAMLFQSDNNRIQSCNNLPQMNLNAWRES